MKTKIQLKTDNLQSFGGIFYVMDESKHLSFDKVISTHIGLRSSSRNSLRELIVGMLSEVNKMRHLSIDYMIKHSTLADANRHRNSDLFAQIYSSTYQRNKHNLNICVLNAIFMRYSIIEH